jgi:apolipoprotein N-acyltransferase
MAAIRMPIRPLDLAPPIAAVATGLLLSAAFPPLEWRDAAWVALVPLVLAARSVAPRRAAKLGFLAGCAFWMPSIAWLRHVSVAGWIALSLYCALYGVPFAWLVARWFGRFGARRWTLNLGFMLAAVCAWTGAEYLRSTLFTGFPWNPLGASQYRNLVLIQAAQWGGVYTVSALVAWVNAGIALTVIRYLPRRESPPLPPRAGGWRGSHPELMMGLLAVAVVVAAGLRQARAPRPPGTPLRVALIQPNIPQEDKWTPDTVDLIYGRLRELTGAALRGPSDLVIWPETAVPDYLRDSEPSHALVRDLATNGTPMLVGSMDFEWRDEGGPRYYNSSFLFDARGALAQAYDKRHLVVFGEYIPLQPYVPFIKALTPISESFSPGSTSTVFCLERPPVRFSVLICFEDTVARLARDSVRNGARLLVNQTNDAWFDPSSASRQHMIQCVFRCVENGVPAVRCANTGVSCTIDRLGRIRDVLDDGAGHVSVMGFRWSRVDVPGAAMPLTFYTRHGDVFAQACLVLGLIAIGWSARPVRIRLRRA